MTMLTAEDIRCLSNEGMLADSITRLLVPKDVANMATTPATTST
jgi:hypothetical protein